MKIFRNFRFTSLTKKRVGKYLIYAFGEIILVVIGILIALWFNQRNQELQQKNLTKQTARQIIKLIELDNADIENILEEWKKLGQTMDTILYQTPYNEPINRSCISCGEVLTGVSLPNISNRIPETISSKNLSEGSILEKLTEIEFHYFEGIEGINLYNDIITKYATKIMEEWQYNQSWFIEYITFGDCKGACIDYFYESTDYRKKIAYYNLLLVDAYYFSLIEFYEKNIKFISDLKKLLEIPETDQQPEPQSTNA